MNSHKYFFSIPPGQRDSVVSSKIIERCVIHTYPQKNELSSYKKGIYFQKEN